MGNVSFHIDRKQHDFYVPDDQQYISGEKEILSTKQTDPTYDQPWYNDGWSVVDFLDVEQFCLLRNNISNTIERVIAEKLNRKIKNFTLEKYHHHVLSDKEHFQIVNTTRDLYEDHFNFPIMELKNRFEDELGFKLTNINPKNNNVYRIILRINRPFSIDFNPPHKDIYEGVDEEDYIPQFLNFWVPICGVTNRSSLPVAPGSHLFSEDKLIRTSTGGSILESTYRVRMVTSWNGDNSLTRINVNEKQALMFSSHLIHGLALNNQPDTTRVCLEFRLFKQ